jgi:hypothetical protein
MTTRTDEDPGKHPDIQDCANVPWHLCRVHSACFIDRGFSRHDLDDVKIFRECILRLPRVEIAQIVTAIQTVCYRGLDNQLPGLPVFDGTRLFKFEHFQCIDGCPVDAESASEKLKLLQDITSSSGLFPGSYWISGITKGKRISVGGEATVSLGHHRSKAIVVREFHPVELSGFGGPEIERMKQVRPFHCCTTWLSLVIRICVRL